MEQKVAELSLHDRLWVWFENNRKQALWGVGALVLVGLIGGYYFYSQGQKEIDAGQALAETVSTTIFSGGAQNPPAESYLKIATEHAGTPAAAQAVLLAGERYYTDGKFADAQTQFDRFIREFGNNAFLPQAMFGKAAALEAQGKTDDAARIYKETGDRFPAANVAPQAKFALARIYESQNKLSDARSMYEEIMRSYNYHSLAGEANMRMEDLKAKMPAPTPTTTIVPAPVTPSAAPAPSTPATQPKK